MANELIATELERGRQAQAAGNAGQARVCARRAAGLAIKAWYQAREGSDWGGDAMTQLTRLKAEGVVPEKVRAAAGRLITKVDFDHTLPFVDDPLVDARLIIDYVQQ